jgi:hypothetical protein
MPIRFPTEAANDPDVGESAPRGRAEDRPGPRGRGDAAPGGGDAKPGKDINQAGFIRERERDPDPAR